MLMKFFKTTKEIDDLSLDYLFQVLSKAKNRHWCLMFTDLRLDIRHNCFSLQIASNLNREGSRKNDLSQTEDSLTF